MDTNHDAPHSLTDNSFREWFGNLLGDILIGTIEDATSK